MGLLDVNVSKEDRVRIDRALDLWQQTLVMVARLQTQELKITLDDKTRSNVTADDIRK